jgi:hypothetical protein
MSDGINFALNATTGTKIGTATTQKLGFYNATPVVQQLAATDLGTVLSNLGLRAAGTAYPITTSGAVQFTGGVTITTTNLTLTDKDIVLGTTTGTKFGTGATQKLSFYGATPIVQPTGNALTALSNLGLVGTPTLAKSDVGLGNVENTALSTWAGTTNITTVGTLTSIGGTAPVADGTYTVGIGTTTNGTITVKGGIITAIQQAS